MNYVYMLACGDGSYYTGWTNRLFHRLQAHDSGQGAKYTKAHRPVRLVYTEACPDKSAAMRREAAIKKLSRREKEALAARAGGGQGANRIFYLMGKSASGKDSLFQSLLQLPQLGLSPLVIYTTRPIREGEREGVEYHFTDNAQADAWAESGKVIEMRAYQTVAGEWRYFTVDDGSFDKPGTSILAIGTPASYNKLCAYFGTERMVPLYIEVENGIRLERALKRERAQEQPRYAELCRRFLADEEDFAPDKLKAAGIETCFTNNGKPGECLEKLADAVLLGKYGAAFVPDEAGE